MNLLNLLIELIITPNYYVLVLVNRVTFRQEATIETQQIQYSKEC